MSDQIFRHLRILQRLTWLQTTLLGVAGLGFLAPRTAAIVQIPLPNGIISYPVWLLGMAGLSSLYATPALWWSFKQLDLHGFTYSRWVNWHAAVLTLCVLFVFILEPSQPGAAMIGTLAGILYGVVSANVISRTSLRLAQDNSNKSEATQNVQATQHESLVLAQQELKVTGNMSEDWRSQIWGNSKHRYFVMGFPVAFPLLLSVLLPLHPMAYWPWLQAYVDWMADIVPAVAKFSAMDNAYSQFVTAVNALMWPVVFGSILYWWFYYLIPLLRTRKAICTKFYNARLEAGLKEAEVQSISKNNGITVPLSWTGVNIACLCIIVWVFLSDFDLMPRGAPIFGSYRGKRVFCLCC
jgi:hypothetical protein